MNKIDFFILLILILWTSYKIISFIYFQKLKMELKHANMETFKKVLGQNYQYRVLYNGLVRCKWYKGWMVVKANFDEQGNLICNNIRSYNFLALKSEILFTG